MTKIQTPHEETIEWLSEYVQEKHDSELKFKDMKKALRDQGKNTVYFHILNNLYMFGSFLKEAQKKPVE